MDGRVGIDTGTVCIGRNDQCVCESLVCIDADMSSALLPSSVLQGTFQNYYKSTLLPSSSSASISLIGSLQVFFLYAAGPLTGRIFDAYGTSVSTIVVPTQRVPRTHRMHARC